MSQWINSSIFYHIYPIGFCGAPYENNFSEPVNRIKKISDIIPHLKEMKINAVYLGPIFESTSHGYDTADYRKIDSRLGTNDDFKEVCKNLHENGIRIVLDGVFNHVGRDFFAFKDVMKNLSSSKYAYWFSGINFGGRSSYGDQFYYEGWQGHYNLVKLNVQNPEVSSYLLETVKFWINEFQIDGLRLDAADCVDFNFWRQLHNNTKSINPDFWLMGEIIHGDYNRFANPEMFDSVTNYECQKGIYSSHNDKNYFEIAYSLNRQFGDQRLYKNLTLYNFVDNHDVNRVSSMLKNQEHLCNVYTLLYTMPGVPSIYYGSEYGIKGEKSNNSDIPLRPQIDFDTLADKNEKLYNHIKKLGEIRLKKPSLCFGEYKQIIVKNQQLVYKRFTDNDKTFIVFNLSENAENLSFNVECRKVFDLLSGKAFECNDCNINVNVSPYTSMILSENIDGIEISEEKNEEVQTGTEVVIGATYKHFKGNTYKVIAIGRHTETFEEMVVYTDGHETWIRPKTMFCETVNDFGNIKNRFQRIN